MPITSVVYDTYGEQIYTVVTTGTWEPVAMLIGSIAAVCFWAFFRKTV